MVIQAQRRDGTGQRGMLDPSRPLRLDHTPDGRTLAVVSIAWLRGRSDADRTALAEQHLSADEAAYGEALPVRKRRTEWLAGRLAIKYGVAAHLRRQASAGAAPSAGATPSGELPATRDIRVRTVQRGLCAGKPYVDAPVEIGLSHAADFAVAACGPRPLGVDLERTREMTGHLARLLALQDDSGQDPSRVRLRGMPLPLRWACKEAVLKYYGFGLRVGGTGEVLLTGWRADGSFCWRAGRGLRRQVPTAGATLLNSSAQEIDGYSLAMVWQ